MVQRFWLQKIVLLETEPRVIRAPSSSTPQCAAEFLGICFSLIYKAKMSFHSNHFPDDSKHSFPIFIIFNGPYFRPSRTKRKEVTEGTKKVQTEVRKSMRTFALRLCSVSTRFASKSCEKESSVITNIHFHSCMHVHNHIDHHHESGISTKREG